MTIQNIELIDNPVWVPAQSTVNGQPDDQTLDRACHQAAADRAAFLKTKLASSIGTTKNLLTWFAAERVAWPERWRFSGSDWSLNGVNADGGATLGLWFPIDLPIGCIITGGEVKITPPIGHSDLPSMPTVYLAGSIAFVSAADLTAYHVTHTVTFSGLSREVGTDQLCMVVFGEYGANALPGIIVSDAKITYTNPFA